MDILIISGEGIPEDSEELTLEKVTPGSYVVVCYAGKRRKLYYVGQVESRNTDGDFEVNFLQRVGGAASAAFVYSEREDDDLVSIEAVELLLPMSIVVGGTERACKRLVFSVNLPNIQ